MAAPSDIPNLYAWWQADDLALSYSNGDPITAAAAWEDKAGSYDLAYNTGYNPYYYEDVIAGHAVVTLPTGGGRLQNAAMDWRTSLSDHTKFIVYRIDTDSGTNGGGIVGSDGGSGSTCFKAIEVSGTVYFRAQFTNTGGARNVQQAIDPNEWHFFTSRQDYNSQLTLSMDGGAEGTQAITTYDATYPHDNICYFGVDGGSYALPASIAEMGVYSRVLSDTELSALHDYLRARYFAVTPEQNEQVRDVLSRRLWLLRRAQGLLEVTVPLWALDADILDRIAVEARWAPAPGAAGWGGKLWQRRAFSIQSQDINLSEQTVTLQLLDRRPLDVLFWDTARTDEAALVLNASRQSGVARIHQGNTIAFARDSLAYIENPSDDSACIEIQAGERALTEAGEYIEEERTNEIIQSSFVNDLTGWSSAGTGVNGSAIATDSDDPFFNSETGAKAIQFTAGTTHTTDLTLTATATASIPANTDCRLSIDHKTDSGEPLYYRLQRSYDSYYWNNATPGWQSGSVNNSLGTVSARSPADRYVSENIDVGSNATTLTLTVLLPSGGTSGRISHLYHAQLEQGWHASSRIITQSVIATRVAADLTANVTTAAKIIDWTRGTVFFEFMPDWNDADADLDGSSRYLWRCTSASSHYLDCYITSGSVLTFRHYNGTQYVATATQSMVRGTRYKIACRWTSSEGELDLAARTISIFVNGTKGSVEANPSSALTFTSPGELQFGSYDGATLFGNGSFRNWQVSPFPLSDEEVARLP